MSKSQKIRLIFVYIIHFGYNGNLQGFVLRCSGFCYYYLIENNHFYSRGYLTQFK